MQCSNLFSPGTGINGYTLWITNDIHCLCFENLPKFQFLIAKRKVMLVNEIDFIETGLA